MSSNLPATIPSLARAFETEREALRATISEDGLSSQKAVVAARQTLDRTGERFAASTEDMQLQKSGLWLLEMVKSGAGAQALILSGVKYRARLAAFGRGAHYFTGRQVPLCWQGLCRAHA